MVSRKTYLEYDASRHTIWAKPCKRCVSHPQTCFGPAYFSNKTLGTSTNCHKCLVDRQRCEGGIVEPDSISIPSSSPPSAAAGKRKVIPTLKAAAGSKTDDEASRRKSSRNDLGSKSSLANSPSRPLKRVADDEPAEEARRSSKVARKSHSSFEPSQSSSFARFAPKPLSAASHSPGGLTSAPSDTDPLLMRLNALEENMRQAHKDNMRRMDELRSLILQKRGGR